MKKSQDQGQKRSRDLGTSSDRAMYSPSEERGRGVSSERNHERDDQSSSSDRSPSRDDQQQYKDHQQRRDESQQQYNSTTREAGGITNRDLSAEQQEQQGVRDRGKTRDKEI
jgi:hypothetical protein